MYIFLQRISIEWSKSALIFMHSTSIIHERINKNMHLLTSFNFYLKHLSHYEQ